VDSAKLNFKYPLYFNSSVEEIEIKSINIIGDLFFKKNNKRIILDNVYLNGYINSDFDENSSSNIEIKDFTYKPKKESVENCINLSGNVKIDNSYFYGDSSCQNRLLHYNGFTNFIININKSYFNGEYKCPFLGIENASKANIKSSLFEKGYSSENIDGGYLK